MIKDVLIAALCSIAYATLVIVVSVVAYLYF